MSNSKLTMPVPRERYQRVDALTGRPTVLQDPCVRVWGWIGGLVDGGLVGWVGVGRGAGGRPFPTGLVDGVRRGRDRIAARRRSRAGGRAAGERVRGICAERSHEADGRNRRPPGDTGDAAKPAAATLWCGRTHQEPSSHADLTVTSNVRRWR